MFKKIWIYGFFSVISYRERYSWLENTKLQFQALASFKNFRHYTLHIAVTLHDLKSPWERNLRVPNESLITKNQVI
jgi:hypothetical protein